ncbi:putative DD41D transposase [Trichonephila clavipes]|nr:putative DD41D transposase [Trichonephila clavipes]
MPPGTGSIKLKVIHPDDTPAEGEPVQICATVTRERVIADWLAKKETKFCRNYTSDSNGTIKYVLEPMNTDSIKISVQIRRTDQNGAVVPDFHKQILFSDEAHFWLNGYVNKQNCRIGVKLIHRVYVETPLHQEKLTVWYALWAGGVIGPYFFKNDEGHNVAVNGDRYRAMITNFFIPELDNHDVQGCGTNKTAQHVMQLVPQSIY